MQETFTLQENSSPRNAEASRIVFILRVVLPAAGIALLAIISIAAIAFAWVRVALLILFLALAALALVGGIYQARAVQCDRRKFPSTGIFSDADGFKLHLLVMGEDNSKLTVILESGMTGFGMLWHWVQAELAQESRVVAYDRAGFGWSQFSPNLCTTQNCAREIHHALVNASHPHQWQHMPIPNANHRLANSMNIQGELCRFAYGRVVQSAAKLITAGLPEKQGQAIVAWCGLRNCWKTEAQQAILWNDISRPQVNKPEYAAQVSQAIQQVINAAQTDEPLTQSQEEWTRL